MKKIPQRTCIGCKEKKDKKELIRIVKDKDGNITLDRTGRANGRGAYLKKDLNVIEKAKNTKALEKHLEVSIK